MSDFTNKDTFCDDHVTIFFPLTILNEPCQDKYMRIMAEVHRENATHKKNKIRDLLSLTH